MSEPQVCLAPSPPSAGIGKPGAKRLKVLISAYACEPGKGSEPGVGWHLVIEAARRHDVWAITRKNNRPAIDAQLTTTPMPSLHMVYYDLPRWTWWWKRGTRGVRLYYYLWQLGLYSTVRRLHHRIRFDVTHHVTFVKYWMPSVLAFLPAPFLWGPVGGGESAPLALQLTTGWRGGLFEILRSIARRCGERDPLVVATARRSTLALAATADTAHRLRVIGAKRVAIWSQAGLTEADRAYLDALRSPAAAEPVRLLSLGNLQHLKGFHLGLRAFAAAGLPNAEYWLVGDGPYRARLQRLVHSLGIDHKVRFCGALPRSEALAILGLCHVLVHPCLHDSGGWACLEAMAAGKPVICLDLGGPSAMVTAGTGFKIAVRDTKQAVQDLTQAIVALARDSRLRASMGQAGKNRVTEEYAWERKGEFVNALYHKVAEVAHQPGALDGDL